MQSLIEKYIQTDIIKKKSAIYNVEVMEDVMQSKRSVSRNSNAVSN